MSKLYLNKKNDKKKLSFIDCKRAMKSLTSTNKNKIEQQKQHQKLGINLCS